MPSSSSGRSARCSACPRSRLPASSGSSTTLRVQRSTPPAASSLDTAATSCGHVSQNVVGNGSPASSNAACSVTAGCPERQRTTTRLKARGGLPSWRSTTARSLSIPVDTRVRVLPGLDSLDDEEVLAWTDVAEPPCFARERLARRRRLHLLKQRALLRRELRDLGLAGGELVTRLHPATQRVIVRIADQDHEQHRELAAGQPWGGGRRGCPPSGRPRGLRGGGSGSSLRSPGLTALAWPW